MLDIKDKLNKIIEYGLYLLAFLLPWQTRWIIKAGSLNGGNFEYGTIALYGTDILIVLLLTIFTIQKLKIKNSKFKTDIFWWLIAGLDLFAFISIFLAPDKILAGYKYFVFLLGVGLFWLITRAIFDKLKFLFFLLVGIFLQAFLGIWQFLNQSSFANKWLGIALHNPFESGTAVVEAMGSSGFGERWLRAYGGLDHPNILGGVLAIGILLCLYLILKKSGEKIPTQIKNSSKSKYLLFIFYIIFFTSITAIFFTFSRAAWIAAVIGILIILAGLVYKKDLPGQQTILPIILTMIILVFCLTALFKNLVDVRLSGDTRLENKSNSERSASYREAWFLIKKHPVFGVGIGNYSIAAHNEIITTEPSWYYQPTHNVFLLVVSEVGILGAIFYVCLLIYALFLNFKLLVFNNASGRKLDNIINISLVCILVILMMFDHWLWSLHFGMLLFWLCLGLIVREKSKELLE